MAVQFSGAWFVSVALVYVVAKVETHCVDVVNCSCFQDNANNIIADCSRKQLFFIPKFQTNVTIIDLSYNNIFRLLPAIHNGVGLGRSDESMNERNPFLSLTRLNALDLSNNRLEYTRDVFPADVFQGLKNLEVLNIQQNNNYKMDQNLSYPGCLGQLTKLKRLGIDGLDATLRIPRTLPAMSALKSLDMSGETGFCYMKAIRSQFLRDVPNLEFFNVSSCALTYIENGTFKALSKLIYLNISYNDGLTFAVLPNVTCDLQYTNITTLDISGLHCMYGVGTFLFVNDFKCLQNTSLENFVCNSNRLVQLEDQFTYHFPSTVKFVEARDNRLTFGIYVLEMAGLLNLKRGDFSNQYNSHDPSKQTQLDDCYDWRGPPKEGHLNSVSRTRNVWRNRPKDGRSHLVKNQRYNWWGPPQDDHPFVETRQGKTRAFTSDIVYQKVDKPIQWIFIPPPNMTELIFENADLVYKIPKLLIDANNDFQMVSFKGNFLHTWIGPVTNLHALVYLDLSYNYCSYVSTFFFNHTHKLQTLLISHNYLGFMLFEDRDGQTFQHLANLETIDLSYNRISDLGSMILKNQTNMVTLNLSSNLLRQFNVKLGHMQNLKYLDLSDNQLPYLNPTTRSEISDLFTRTNLSIDLSKNPFQCSCEKKDFLGWIMENKGSFLKFEKYQCSLSNGTVMSFCNLSSTLVELERKCASYVVLILGVVSAIVLALSVTIGGLVYRYRWRLRYLYYMARNKFTLKDHARGKDRLIYTYDAFISHAEEDSEFVLGDLLKNLEENSQLSVCLHQRDFIAGRNIAENITNAIHNSRKTLVILSPDFLRSNWCMFELNIARMEGIYSRENTNNIFLVFYKHVRPEDIPLPVMELVNSNTYLEYPGSIHGDAVFWDKMAQALVV
ncbi:toll-like receptor 4 [Argopecten irradians]|uniref:toll-like receptor 4 n=1 Tax=Argopecten irradians TaxID=31199 RepID=UPI003722DEAC